MDTISIAAPAHTVIGSESTHGRFGHHAPGSFPMARRSSATSTLQTLLHEPERFLQTQPVLQRRHPLEDTLAFLGGALLGALIGAAIAILFAPSDGETLRQRIKRELGMVDDDSFEAPAATPVGTPLGTDTVTSVPAPAATVVSPAAVPSPANAA